MIDSSFAGLYYPLCYNIWGFGCVKLTLGAKVIRVGTDDVANLAEFLRKKAKLLNAEA